VFHDFELLSEIQFLVARKCELRSNDSCNFPPSILLLSLLLLLISRLFKVLF